VPKTKMPSVGYTRVSTRVHIHLEPVDLADVNHGVKRQLDKLLMRWSEHLQGVVVGYENIKYEKRVGALAQDSPYVHFFVRAALLLFKPVEGAMLVGVVNKVSVDHIGLLVEGIFNASIASSQIAEQYEYDEEEDRWCDKDFDHPHIEPGSHVKFKVVGLETLDFALSIVGSLKDNASGLVQDAASEEAAATSSDGNASKKKRKLDGGGSAAVVDDDDDGDAAADDDGGAGAGAADIGKAGGVAKKAEKSKKSKKKKSNPDVAEALAAAFLEGGAAGLDAMKKKMKKKKKSAKRKLDVAAAAE